MHGAEHDVCRIFNARVRGLTSTHSYSMFLLRLHLPVRVRLIYVPSENDVVLKSSECLTVPQNPAGARQSPLHLLQYIRQLAQILVVDFGIDT
jgi:hypothetical protein